MESTKQRLIKQVCKEMEELLHDPYKIQLINAALEQVNTIITGGRFTITEGLGHYTRAMVRVFSRNLARLR